VTVPCVLSFLATGSTDGRVEGINQLREQYAQQYGTDPGTTYYHPGDYVPVIPVTYWSFRFMIGLGVFAAFGAALILYLTRRGRTPSARWLGWLAIALPVVTVGGSSFGWLFTEMGRQPWVVFGLMTTEQGVSPSVSTFEALTSVVVLTLLYAGLGVVELRLLATYVKKGADPFEEPPEPTLRGRADEDAPLTVAY
jgi:cytochrome d ubiquinol oxidase subunit I